MLRFVSTACLGVFKHFLCKYFISSAWNFCDQADSWQTSLKHLRHEHQELQRQIGVTNVEKLVELQQQHSLHRQTMQVGAAFLGQVSVKCRIELL